MKLSFTTLLFTTLLSTAVKAQCVTCTTLDFGKKADVNKLIPLLSGNTKDKMQYLQSEGLDVFKVTSNEPEPPTLTFLAAPPPILLDVFGKHFLEGTLGIYLTERAHRNYVEKPTILFIESADSWTLAHEFMHHLFDRARFMEDARTESLIVNNMNDAKEDFLSYWDRYKSHQAYSDQHHKEATISSFVAFSKVQQQLLLSFEMEEMAIERYIRTLYLSPIPHDLDQESFHRSTRYIQSTGTKALAILEVALDTCLDLEKTLLKTDQSLNDQLRANCTAVKNLKNSILSINKEMNIANGTFQ